MRATTVAYCAAPLVVRPSFRSIPLASTCCGCVRVPLAPRGRETSVAKYLITGSYTQSGIAGVIAEGGSARRDVVGKLAKSVGGSLESFYLGFGSDDFHIVVDLPSAEAAAAVGMTVGASGGATIRTTVLLTAEQVDAAAKLSPSYRAPGR